MEGEKRGTSRGRHGRWMGPLGVVREGLAGKSCLDAVGFVSEVKTATRASPNGRRHDCHTRLSERTSTFAGCRKILKEFVWVLGGYLDLRSILSWGGFDLFACTRD